MKKILVLLIIGLSPVSRGQKNIFLTINPKVNGADLQLMTNFTNLDGTAFKLDHFDYYLSGIHLIHDGGQDLDLSNLIFLVEPENYVLYLGYIEVNQIEAIQFSVGIPPNLNTSSGSDAVDISTYPSNHPLSFQEPSMYWGWTSGYMHMIVGGYADQNFDGEPDNLFELHNLGDANYRSVQLNINPTNTEVNQLDIYLNCNIENWIKDIAIESAGIVHGSSGLNMEIMKNIETEAVFTQSALAGVVELIIELGTLSHFRDQVFSKVIWKEMVGANQYNLINSEGRLIAQGKINFSNGEIVFDELPQGVYYFSIYDLNQNLLNSFQFVH
jgi:hypothetical protein